MSKVTRGESDPPRARDSLDEEKKVFMKWMNIELPRKLALGSSGIALFDERWIRDFFDYELGRMVCIKDSPPISQLRTPSEYPP